MPKLLRLLFALLPVCGLGFLASAGPLLPHLTTPPSTLGCRQQEPASMNEIRRIILASQYHYYQRSRCRPDLALAAAALYNQCVEDSDPSALRGTGLPAHLP